MQKTVIRNAFQRNRKKKLNVTKDGEKMPSLTQQSFKDEVDINNVIKQYDKTGLITHVTKMKLQYGDYTAINEYQESLNLVIKAQDEFNALPSNIRKRFGNDPGLFLEFVSNPENKEELIKMGLTEYEYVEEVEISSDKPLISEDSSTEAKASKPVEKDAK